MNSRFSDHIRSNVVGYVALFLALSITPAWAAALAPDSVKSRTIQDGQVKTADLGANAVTTDKIADGSVGTADVNSGQVQLRVSGTCSAGSAVSAIAANGTVSCETDDVGGSSGPPSGPAGGDLTGTYPNPTITSNAVGSSEISDGTVSSADILNSTVASTDILDSTIVGADIANGTVASTDILDSGILSGDIATGAVASTDILDDTVASGDIAANAVGHSELDAVSVRTDEFTADGGDQEIRSVDCNAGEILIGGGGGSRDPNMVVNSSHPGFSDNWTLITKNNGFATQEFDVFAICLAS